MIIETLSPIVKHNKKQFCKTLYLRLIFAPKISRMKFSTERRARIVMHYRNE